ncbi:MAG: hypothetical protein MZW92_38720 [Comamonadaceae bacterium]|nr:hypothetical protein [Comamonadaceae bacterium]
MLRRVVCWYCRWPRSALVIGPGWRCRQAPTRATATSASGGPEHKEIQGAEATKDKEHAGKFRDEDRVIVHDFYVGNPSALPPGLAKRGGQLPPGLAKRGGQLPPGHVTRRQVITPEIEVHLMPLPRAARDQAAAAPA